MSCTSCTTPMSPHLPPVRNDDRVLENYVDVLFQVGVNHYHNGNLHFTFATTQIPILAVRIRLLSIGR